MNFKLHLAASIALRYPDVLIRYEVDGQDFGGASTSPAQTCWMHLHLSILMRQRAKPSRRYHSAFCMETLWAKHGTRFAVKVLTERILAD
jgi:hypothetical protein